VLLFTIYAESTMAKGQQKSNKETKKPKKEAPGSKPTSGAGVVAGEPVRPTVTTYVAPRGKLKNK